MRAALCRSLGAPEQVVVEEIEAPLLQTGKVRVGVRAAAVNYPDVLLVAGEYQVKVPPPFVPGSELAGEVLEVGEGIVDLVVGEMVFGSTMVGAFAEEAVMSATSLTKVPKGVALPVAAAFGVAHRTAYHVLRSVARLEPGEELVVLGAGGGVGLATVQLGSLLGAKVTAVASTPEKLEVAARFGASRQIDHRHGDLRQSLKTAIPEGADVVVDPVGGVLSEPSLRSLRFGGRFVTVGYAAGEIPRIPLNLVLLKGIAVLGFQMIDFARYRAEDRRRDEAELISLLAAGRVFPHIGASFPLDEAPAALRFVADGRAVGKVVLRI